MLWLIGAGLIVLLSTISYEVRGAPLAPASGPVARLDVANPVIQRMTIETLGLQGFEMGIIPPVGAEPLSVTLQLRVADSGLPDLVRAEQVLAPGLAAALRFDFPPLTTRLAPYAITSTLDLTIEAASMSATAPLTLLGGPATSLAARLQAGPEESLGVALHITPLYQRRLLDSAWPISTMASGRSGVFGWPPLYPMLAYGSLVGFYYCIVSAVWHLQNHELAAADIDAG
jgi:hypothetical protein